MKKAKRYFIIYDLYAVLLVLVFILFDGLSRSTFLLYNGKVDYVYVLYNILGILVFLLICIALFSRVYTITDNYFIKGLIFIKKIKWSDITNIEQEKLLRIKYVSEKEEHKICSIRFFCINNNKKKYILLVNDIIKNYNISKNDKNSISAQEILDNIQDQKIHTIIDKNYKFINKRGFLLVFILFFIYGTGDSIFNFFNSFGGIKDISMFFSKELYYFYIGIHIILLVKIILKLLVAIYLLSKKIVAIKIVQYYYFFEIALIGISRILMVYSAAKFYEPTILVSFLFVLTGIMSSTAFALLAKRYFTTSIRVKSAYIE